MISTTAEYALRAVVFLATVEDAATAQRIAKQTRVPLGYLHKTMHQLVRAGVASSRRGPGGGFTLSRPAAKISVLDVVNAVDPIRRIHECPLKLPEHAGTLCPLHRRLDEAIAVTERAFAESTIAELVSKPARGKGAQCSFPLNLRIDR